MSTFKLTDELIEQIELLITEKRNKELETLLNDMHYADIAEIIHELDIKDAIYIIRLLDTEKTSDVITELDEDFRDKILENMSAKEIADELIELDTDDAADIISELPEKRKTEVISYIEDVEHAKDIVELLRYDEDTAGGLMAKELVRVNENWNVLKCVKEMREQAEFVKRVHSIYVVDDNDVLKGRLSLKDLLTTSTRSNIKDIYIPKVDYVYVTDTAEDVARIMAKYDLEAIPVVDEMKRLVGRITIDDVVDVIKEEAEKDYQLAAGITHDVEADDSIWKLTKARLPWLLIGMFGGLGAASIINGFQGAMERFPVLLIFIPLIQATAGNVGVQSSAIVVQGLANDSIDGEIWGRLLKEFLLGLINGLAIAAVVILVSHFAFQTSYLISLTVAVALVTVIINAAVIGTFIPIFLHKRGIDPAVATGPFITTSNDVLGILIYFSIAKIVLGF
ncbi:magnesium transporter [Capnocytophaga stomatis]|uniref:Magnesium transporter MgtE n=1 Tax=Capnocytophaga stomatis TaxID=1848904 RepID=A0ABW8QA38_9FLAO|nr:magnesium transporter [Capnocytophaga stomatis]GIJ95221.1 magnesium transporter MgtE [Capnocytophaga stomatis]GIJ97040.1 magnesium transporter MgtE [Capnocytophaga stomatis]